MHAYVNPVSLWFETNTWTCFHGINAIHATMSHMLVTVKEIEKDFPEKSSDPKYDQFKKHMNL